MSIAFPVSAKVIRDRYVAAFPVPQKPTPGNADDAFENICRAWVLALAEQVRFATNDPRWGVKNAGGGRPQSKDSLTWNGERLVNFDLLSGVGTGKPTLVKDPAGEDITGQTFMPVQPVNHLDAPPPAPPLLTPDPIPLDPGPSDIAASLAVIVLGLGDLRAKLETLDAQLTVMQRVVVDLAARKPPSYRGKLGMTISLDPQL